MLPTPDPARVKHIEQLNDTLCGAACAEMILKLETPNTDDQNKLYKNHTHDGTMPVWFSSPEGIASSLRDRVDISKHDRYQVSIIDSEEGLSRKICWSITKHHEAPIVVVYDRDHWIVCTGCVTSKVPARVDDIGYRIEYMFVNNPYMRRSLSSVSEDMLEVVTYQEWRRHYVSQPIPMIEETICLRGKYVMVADSERAGKFKYETYEPIISSNKIMDEGVAKTVAASMLASEKVLSTYDPWRSFFGKVEAISLLLVNDKDGDNDETFWIAYKWNSADHPSTEIPLIIRVSARHRRQFRGAVAVPNGSVYAKDHPEMLSHASVREHFRDAIFIREQTEKRYRFSDGELQQQLYWRSCLESLTPYLPFYRVFFYEEQSDESRASEDAGLVGNEGMVDEISDGTEPNQEDQSKRLVTFYIRLDGSVFSELHTKEAVGA
jgi:hypothetical protein